MENTEPIHHPLKKWRLERGLSPKDAAKRLECTVQTVHRYEAGRMPDQPYLDRIIVMTDGAVTANDWLGKEAADVAKQRAAA